ncbi:hypothetical protein Lal_00024330, partial [Lupinus albus]
MFFDTPRTWILYEPMDRDKSLLLAMTSSFITSSFPYPYPFFSVQRKGGALIKNRFQSTMLARASTFLFINEISIRLVSSRVEIDKKKSDQKLKNASHTDGQQRREGLLRRTLALSFVRVLLRHEI